MVSIGRVACLDLQGGLANHSGQPVGVDLVHLTLERCEAGDGVDIGSLQQCPVEPADTGHVHERIGCAPLGVTHQLELTEPTVVTRLRCRGPGRWLVDEASELTPEAAPVGQHIIDPDRVTHTGPQLDVHVLRHVTGLRGDRLRVETELQHVAGLGSVAGQLGIDRLVGDVAVFVDHSL